MHTKDEQRNKNFEKLERMNIINKSAMQKRITKLNRRKRDDQQVS